MHCKHTTTIEIGLEGYWSWGKKYCKHTTTIEIGLEGYWSWGKK